MTSSFTLNQIRSVFLDYFKKQGHTIVPSSSLVPHNDPTLLFTNAGMVQFKDYYTGKETPPFSCASTAQKCVRAGGKHNDLENVGYTARHHTFFEMLGNFSFGAYFKEQAIVHAWTVVTKELGLDPARLYVTVYTADEEARKIWQKVTGFSDDRIIRISTKDNFWSMGDTGPCGPCSEIFYDHGPSIKGGLPGSVDEDGDRYTEIWNLVFMQYEQMLDGRQIPLPKPCIDTGMGLERIAAVLQGKDSNFDIDLFEELIFETQRLVHDGKTSFQKMPLEKLANRQSYNVIADHIRAMSFLIADGVLPLNEGRGYVLRRIMRRAIRHVRVLGKKDPTLYLLVPKLIELMGEAYPELPANKALIEKTIEEEEQKFGFTLDVGLKLVDEMIARLSGSILPGDIAFKLYDTYGFPVDLTSDILRSKGLSVDLEGFEKAMAQQKEQSRKTKNLGIKLEEKQGDHRNVLEQENIPETVKDFHKTEKLTVHDAHVLSVCPLQKDTVSIVLDHTPFFGQSGGQVGDTGILMGPNWEAQVVNTQIICKNNKSWISHECKITKTKKGEPCKGDLVTAKVDAQKRLRTAAHHSATHLLQAALRQVLGDNISQRGSFVDSQRLRFDFTSSKGLTQDEIEKVEQQVNDIILAALPCSVVECSLEEAQKMGAIALFDEKYGKTVRVVQLGEISPGLYFSKEFCGGTHVSNTGKIGLFHIVSEEGIASGIRRIEASCGLALLEYFREKQQEQSLQIEKIREDCQKLNHQLHQAELALTEKEACISSEQWGGTSVLIYQIPEADSSLLQELADKIAKTMKEDILVLFSCDEPVRSAAQPAKVSALVRINRGAIKAQSMISVLAPILDAKGGGKDRSAQCGGKNPKGIPQAIEALKHFIKNSAS